MKFYPSLQESPLPCLDVDVEAYRLLYISSFEGPASVRIWRQGDLKFIEQSQLHEIGIPRYGAKDLNIQNLIRSPTRNEITFRNY